MLTTVVISALCLAQRSEAEIRARREASALFTPTIERMMRATDSQLVVFAGSTTVETRKDALAKLDCREAVPALRVALNDRSPEDSNAPYMERRSIAAIKEALKTLGAG